MILPSGLSTYSYSSSAAMKGWGPGWPTCGPGPTVTVTLARSGVKLYQVHYRIARLLELLLNEIERRGHLFHPGWCWGGACRQISGTSVASNHSWYLAVDLDAPANPYTASAGHTIPDFAYSLFRAYGFGLGADYTGAKKDWMHIEFMGNTADATLMTALAERAFGTRLAEADRTPSAAPAVVPVPTEEDSMVRLIRVPDGGIWIVDLGAHTKWHVGSIDLVNWARAVGVPMLSGDQPPWLLDGFRDVTVEVKI